MDRSIKFRGESIETGELVYGGVSEDKEFIIKVGLAIPVDPKTVGQFTGLYDAEKQEIYEDDLIQNTEHPELIYKVEFQTDCWVGVLNDDGWLLGNLLDAAPFKIVGNILIHDNKEKSFKKQINRFHTRAFTGFRDCEGTKIFEGDVLQAEPEQDSFADSRQIYIVTHNGERFILHNRYYGYDIEIEADDQGCIEGFLYMTNIYDEPEYLEEG